MSDERKAVFLSYASQDAEAAKRICESLRQAGVEVWFDQSELRGGDAWDQKIRKQIKECALFVPVVSANTQARAEGYFRLEWRLAAQRTHMMSEQAAFLLPLVIDATRDAEADVPGEFKAVQWTRLANIEASQPFCERVRKLLGREEVARAPQPVGADDTGGKARATPPAAEKTIAVLAFANMSRDPDNEYFSDGITEELLNVLAKVPGLRVTARTSAFYFKGKNVPVPEIARQLGVSHVIEGSVRKAGDRVRITAQLINASDGFHLWSDTFDRELKDIFAVQDEIAALIARNLQLKLSDTRRAAHPVNPEAYRLCLEGRKAGIVFSEEGFAQAEALFKRALTIDPSFARSQADLALLGLCRASLRSVAAKYFPADVDAAEHHAREALRMDSGVGEPHITLAYVALLRGQQPEAERELQQAIEICPESEHRFMVQAFILIGSGRPDRAALEMQKARRRDPISWLPADLAGLSLTLAGRPAEALEPFARAEQLGGPPVVYANHALAFAKLGRRDEAIAQARLAVDAAQRAGWEEGFLAQTRGFAARVLAESGLTDEAAALVQRLQSGPVPLRCHAGMGLIALGETDAGFALLPEFPRHVFGYVMHFLQGRESLRDDPRTAELLTKVGATEAFETMGCVLRGEPMPP